YYYYNALKYFENKKTTRKTKMDIITQAYTYNNIANLQKDEKDYLGSQSTIVQGINFILSTSDIEENKEYLSNAYNLLGLNLKKLKEYDKSFEYYQKSIDYSHNIQEEDINKLYAKINIAELHKTKGNYTKVFDVYDELLKDPDLFGKDPASYGAI